MTTNVAENVQKAVIFAIDEKEYAINVGLVLSIERILPMTRVPNVPDYIKGVINLRGKIVPIMDLRLRLSMQEAPYTEESRIIILNVEGKELGFIVDKALDVIDFSDEDIEDQPKVSGTQKEEFIKGVFRLGERLIILLDIDVILYEKGKM